MRLFTHNFSGDFQIFVRNNFFIFHNKKTSSHQLAFVDFPYSHPGQTLYRNFFPSTTFSGLFGISRLSRLATGRGFLDSGYAFNACLLLLHPSLGILDCDNLSTIPFLSPSWVHPFSHHQGAVHYPQLSLFRSVPSLTSVFLSKQVAYYLH